jgi:hypothetical protein
LKNSIIILMSVFLISSCSTSNISNDFELQPNTDKGIVIGSITYDGGYSEYSIKYSQFYSGDTGYFKSGRSLILIPYFPDGEFEELGIKGNLIAAELPYGNYEINSWGVGSGPSTVSPTKPFSIKFTVTPGEAIYLGNFHFTELDSLGLTITGARVDYSDKRSRDIKAFSQNYVGLNETPIGASIAKGTRVNRLGGNYETRLDPIVPVGFKSNYVR